MSIRLCTFSNPATFLFTLFRMNIRVIEKRTVIFRKIQFHKVRTHADRCLIVISWRQMYTCNTFNSTEFRRRTHVNEREKYKNFSFIMILNCIVGRNISRKAECFVFYGVIVLLLTVISNYNLRRISYSGNEHEVIIDNFFSVRKVSGITISIYLTFLAQVKEYYYSSVYVSFKNKLCFSCFNLQIVDVKIYNSISNFFYKMQLLFVSECKCLSGIF